MRLDIAAGTAVRFEPGQSRTVRLPPYLGARESHGFQAKVSGKLGPIAKVGRSNEGPMRSSRAAYAGMFGPTTGDKVRLADTELFIEVEKDHTTYGEEVKFGGGKVIRDGMGQSQKTRAQGAVDTVITNALILDHWGIVKADIGLRGGPHQGGRGPRPRAGRAAPPRAAGPRAQGPKPAGTLWPADEPRLLRQGQHPQARRPQGADRRRRLRSQAARGLGHHACRDR